MLHSLWTHRTLSWQLARREVVGRYKGSILGLAWSFFNPLLMLVVYTLFFTQVFQARWGTQATGKGVFATALFVGLIIHGVLAESAVKSTASLVGNPNYVKKIVFPIEILPWISVLAALFHGLLGLVVLLMFALVFNGGLVWTIFLWPLMLVPLSLLCLGLGWLLSAAAVYFRDVGQMVGVLVTALLFTSPVFFSSEGLPPKFARLISYNPLTYLIEQSRDLLLWGAPMDWLRYGRYTLLAGAFAWLGFAFFQRVRRGFSDVL